MACSSLYMIVSMKMNVVGCGETGLVGSGFLTMFIFSFSLMVNRVTFSNNKLQSLCGHSSLPWRT